MKTYRTLGLFLISLFFSIHSFAQSDPIHLTISAYQADTLIRQYADSSNFVILDVRTPSEYKTGFIEGAMNLNYYDELFDANLAILDKSKVYLIYCAGGGRSGAALNKMIALNFLTVYNLQGGINAWRNAGFPVIISTGIDAFNLVQNIILYPNPASDFINLELAAFPSGSILLFSDANGRRVYQEDIKAGENIKTIAINKWDKGLYLVNLIKPDGQKHTRKIVIN
jgi:rhodanese-related sulfurtransferase